MAGWKSFEELDIWKSAREMDGEIYACTRAKPLSHDFPLRDQMLRASGSIMDNIAEGFERGGNKEFIQFLSIAKGSCGELRSQLFRCLDRNYLLEEKCLEMMRKSEILSKQIGSLIKYLKRSNIRGIKYK